MTDSRTHSWKDGRTDSRTERRSDIRTAGKTIAEHTDHKTDGIAYKRADSRRAA
jgi:hypothetical protein